MSTRRRIDARNQADPAVRAGIRNIHRGMNGGIIGGETAEGVRFGTKGGGRTISEQMGNAQGWAATRRANYQPAQPTGGGTVAAQPGTQLLASRQKLFADMTAAGDGLFGNQDLRQRARDLGIDDAGFQRAAARIPAAPAARPAWRAPAPHVATDAMRSNQAKADQARGVTTHVGAKPEGGTLVGVRDGQQVWQTKGATPAAPAGEMRTAGGRQAQDLVDRIKKAGLAPQEPAKVTPNQIPDRAIRGAIDAAGKYNERRNQQAVEGVGNLARQGVEKAKAAAPAIKEAGSRWRRMAGSAAQQAVGQAATMASSVVAKASEPPKPKPVPRHPKLEASFPGSDTQATEQGLKAIKAQQEQMRKAREARNAKVQEPGWMRGTPAGRALRWLGQERM